jgi:hypothetical protein
MKPRKKQVGAARAKTRRAEQKMKRGHPPIKRKN